MHFVAFFGVASLLSIEVDNEKVEVDNEKAPRAGQQNNLFIFQPGLNIETSPKNATKHPEQFQRFPRDFVLENTLNYFQLISFSDNMKILLTSRNVRLNSGHFETKY